tara:strand:+ start:773 stop:1108 length:336 start_codon:yes stop_codon:yes gene_type:complete
MSKYVNKELIEWQDETNATSLFIKCECYSEGIELQYYHEDDTDKGFYVNYWKYGINGRYSEVSWWDRIRFAWKLLRKGTLHGDQIILSIKDAHLMKQYLDKHIQYDEGNLK